MSIRLRLTLWYSGILSVVLLIFGLGLYGLVYHYYFQTVEDDLQEQAEKVFSRIEPRMTMTLRGGITPDFVLQGRDIINNTGKYYQVANFENGNISRSENLSQLNLSLPELTSAKKQRLVNEGYFIEHTRIENLNVFIYNRAVPLVLNGQPQLAGVFQAAVFLTADEKLFTLLRNILLITALVTVMLAASLGWYLARKALRPIEQVIAATNSIEKGTDLHNRINYYGPNDEIGRLTATINGMLGRLQHTYSELEEVNHTQRRFVSDASHELRTPLTTIRGNVDLLEKMWKRMADSGMQQDSEQIEMSLEAMHDIASEAARMSRLVNDLLSLARADAGFQIAKIEQDILPIVEDVVRKAQLLPRTVEWSSGDLSALNGVQVYGSRDYLQQLLFIFIENAFKYTEVGFVKLDSLRTDNQIGIRIEDSGLGMDKEEVPLIFERFYRADLSRGKTAGTGLGLSIAKWIIDEHQGSIEVKTTQGEGSIFIIWLPITVPSDSSDLGISIPTDNQV
ncbi:cell wall metabolism sensor histidine kinase WalK [Paenibacillus sp. FSL H7-0331]|uniref:sensor histidine kinase n=1 Tax=Paenibacillus sp. FSL H7-0331 TaxID=1920421 RepID=UPI00096D2D2C|nr:HAMP domain-containing sensor histidine kinase [Paenibacillus sp. FSL H7-0331]OMF10772.1 two-component sensor histidine kinase [Paenibacillus sp. FSL H7-0331]